MTCEARDSTALCCRAGGKWQWQCPPGQDHPEAGEKPDSGHTGQVQTRVLEHAARDGLFDFFLLSAVALRPCARGR